MDKKQLTELLMAVGALAEISVQFYKAAVHAGASQEEALNLTKAMIQATLSQKPDKD